MTKRTMRFLSIEIETSSMDFLSMAGPFFSKKTPQQFSSSFPCAFFKREAILILSFALSKRKPVKCHCEPLLTTVLASIRSAIARRGSVHLFIHSCCINLVAPLFTCMVRRKKKCIDGKSGVGGFTFSARIQRWF